MNGLQSATASSSTAVHAGSGHLAIGSSNTVASVSWNGYVDEFRVSNVARYSSAFTPRTRRSPWTRAHRAEPLRCAARRRQRNPPDLLARSGPGRILVTDGRADLPRDAGRFGLTSLSLGTSDGVSTKLPTITGPWTVELFAHNASPGSQTLVGSAGIALALVSGNLRLTLEVVREVTISPTASGMSRSLEASGTTSPSSSPAPAYLLCFNGAV